MLPACLPCLQSIAAGAAPRSADAPQTKLGAACTLCNQSPLALRRARLTPPKQNSALPAHWQAASLAAAACAPPPLEALSVLRKRLRGRVSVLCARLAGRRGKLRLASGYPDWRPRRVVLVRHGESAGNVNEDVYSQTPDAEVPLTERGRAQACAAGRRLRHLLPRETARAEIVGPPCVQVVTSPYRRTMETLEGLLEGWSLPEASLRPVRQDPRLREQEFSGGLQLERDAVAQMKADRRGGAWKTAKFFWRFPDGESGADVYDRATAALDSLFRSWGKQPEPACTVIVAHGLLIRLLLMRYFRWTAHEFDALKNPPNCSMIVLERQPTGHYRLLRNPECQELDDGGKMSWFLPFGEGEHRESPEMARQASQCTSDNPILSD